MPDGISSAASIWKICFVFSFVGAYTNITDMILLAVDIPVATNFVVILPVKT